MTAVQLNAWNVAQQLGCSVYEVLITATESGVDDFAIDEELFDGVEVLVDFDSFSDDECERIVFALEDWHEEKFTWLTGRLFTT